LTQYIIIGYHSSKKGGKKMNIKAKECECGCKREFAPFPAAKKYATPYCRLKVFRKKHKKVIDTR
jgi:hypothetical protein